MRTREIEKQDKSMDVLKRLENKHDSKENFTTIRRKKHVSELMST